MSEPLLLEAEHSGWWLKYGPVGDPEGDFWERTQSVMPPGWHFENQIVRYPAGQRAQGTTKDGRTATAWGASEEEAAARLVWGLWDGHPPDWVKGRLSRLPRLAR